MLPVPYKIESFTDSSRNEYYLVIDTLFNGTSGGGIRIHDDVTLEEVTDLAKNMSFKFAIYDIPMGGAKIGIRLKDETIKREALANLKEYLRPFIKSYLVFPGKDLGITEEEVALIYKKILRQKHNSYSSYYTAVGLIACLNFIKSQYGLKDIKVALSGFGRVGYFLVKKLVEQGINLVAISNKYGCIYKDNGLDKEELLKLREQFNNDEWIFHIKHKILSKEILYTLPVDILIPGAEAYAINKKNINYLKTKFICPVANITYHKDILSELNRRRVIFFPDFVSNGGGALGSHLLSWGFSFKETERLVTSKITKTLHFLYRNSKKNYYGFALKLAEDKLKMRNELEEKFAREKIFHLIRNYCRTLKNIFPRLLLRNYYTYILKYL